MKTYKLISILLAAVMVAGLLAGCGGQVEPSLSTAPSPSPSPVSEPTPKPSVFPAYFTAYGEDFTLKGYKIKTGADGNAVVNVYAKGYIFSAELSQEQRYKIALGTFVIAGEAREVPTDSYTFLDSYPINGLSEISVEVAIVYPLDTSVSPETITLTNGDTGEIIISFTVADEPQTMEPAIDTDDTTVAGPIHTQSGDLTGVWFSGYGDDEFYFNQELIFYENGEYYSLYESEYITIEDKGTYDVSGNRIDFAGIMIITFEGIPDDETESEKFATFKFAEGSLLLKWEGEGEEAVFTKTANTPNIPEPSPKSAVFPVRYDAFDRTFTFTGYIIGTDDDGNTTIKVYGSDYNTISFRNGGWAIPAWGEFTAGGAEYKAKSVTNWTDSLEYIYGVTAAPEVITLVNGDTGEIIISFTVADEPQTEN